MKTTVLTTEKRRLLLVTALTVTALLLGVGYARLARVGIGLSCLFFKITGQRCPGCGISRELTALLCGQFDQFLSYNLLSPLIVFYIVWVWFFAVKNYVKNGKFSYRAPVKWLDVAVLILVLSWWVLRNIIGL